MKEYFYLTPTLWLKKKTNQRSLSLLCTLIDNNICHHISKNLLRTYSAAPVSPQHFDHYDDKYHCL